MRGVIAKLVAAVLLTGFGIFFLTNPSARGAGGTTLPDYKVEWTATKFLVINFDKLMYPYGHNHDFGADPLTNGAKTRLAIGVQEWNVVFKTKIDGCNSNTNNCYQDAYVETWKTGADPAINPDFATDNCFKTVANCQPGGKYAGQWNWSLGGFGVESNYFVWNNQNLRDIVSVETASTTDTNLYAKNSSVYLNTVSDVWRTSQGSGPGFLEIYQCLTAGRFSDDTSCKHPGAAGQVGVNAPGAMEVEYIYTSAPYTWQTGSHNTGDRAQGSVMTGTLAPTKWFVTGTLYNN